MDTARYEFIDAPDDDGSIKVFDRLLEQRVLNLPPVIATKTAIAYANMGNTHGWKVANEWLNGYVNGATDTELILRGLGS